MPGKIIRGNGYTLSTPIPQDMRVGQREAIKRFIDVIRPFSSHTQCPLTIDEMVAAILANTEIDVALKTLSKAFTSIPIPVGTTPTRLVTPNKELRGYLFLNPSQTATSVSTQVNIASVAYAAGSTPTAATVVSGHRTVRVFMDITVAAGTSLRVDAQSQDPQTGNWVTTQTDIFAGANSVGTFYASLGELGVDTQFRLLVVVVGTALTASFTLILKEIQASVIAGQTVFLSGSPDITIANGFPLLGGQSREFWLRDNTQLFAVAAASGATIQRFDLQ